MNFLLIFSSPARRRPAYADVLLGNFIADSVPGKRSKTPTPNRHSLAPDIDTFDQHLVENYRAASGCCASAM
jgi:hypothetical protein